MNKILGILGVLAVLVWVGTAYSTTLTVNQTIGPYTSIQAAINAAGYGDTVEITDSAIYNEDLSIGGKKITVRSATGQKATVKKTGASSYVSLVWLWGLPATYGPADPGGDIVIENLIIDGNGINPCVRIENWTVYPYLTYNLVPPVINWVAKTVLKDCEIRNSATWIPGVTAAPNVWQASGAIHRAGVAINTDSVVIENCDIHGHGYAIFGNGGGPHSTKHVVDNLHIIGGTIHDNVVGLAIWEYYTSSAYPYTEQDILIDGVTFEYNHNWDGSGTSDGGTVGFSISTYPSGNGIDNVKIKNCTFDNNSARAYQPVVRFQRGQNYLVENCEFVDNKGSFGNGTPGQVDVGIALRIGDNQGVTANVVNSAFYNHALSIYSDTTSSGNTNVSGCVIVPADEYPGWGPGGRGVIASREGSVNVENSTFVNRLQTATPGGSTYERSAALLAWGGTPVITATDCIIDGFNLAAGITAVGGSNGTISISYSDTYNNGLLGGKSSSPGAPIVSIAISGGNNISVDPEFYQDTTFGAAGYLNLSCDTPMEVLLGASDGLYMGALPVYGGPCDLSDDDAADIMEECAIGAGNHGEFVSCVADVANNLIEAGYLQGAGELVRQAARSSTGKPSTAGPKK